jgi:hypothetical protein
MVVAGGGLVVAGGDLSCPIHKKNLLFYYQSDLLHDK